MPLPAPTGYFTKPLAGAECPQPQEKRPIPAPEKGPVKAKIYTAVKGVKFLQDILAQSNKTLDMRGSAVKLAG
jgi:hypothetical protein